MALTQRRYWWVIALAVLAPTPAGADMSQSFEMGTFPDTHQEIRFAVSVPKGTKKLSYTVRGSGRALISFKRCGQVTDNACDHGCSETQELDRGLQWEETLLDKHTGCDYGFRIRCYFGPCRGTITIGGVAISGAAPGSGTLPTPPHEVTPPGPTGGWVDHIKSGQIFQVVFDVAPQKFDDSGWHGDRDPMGTLKGGETYSVRYDPATGWTVTGFNEGTGAVGTWIYKGTRPEDSHLNLWGRVFTFNSQAEVFDREFGLVGHLARAGEPVTVVTQPPATGTPATWATTATAQRGRNGQQFTFTCPPKGSARTAWGTDIYTDDSSICTAAVHAGLITFPAGGAVTIEIRPGERLYGGTSRNGVTTSSYSAWGGSYVFVAGTVSPPTVVTPPPQPRTLRVLVQDDKGRPVSGTSVRVGASPCAGEGTTDSTGAAVLPLPAGCQ